MIQNLEYLAEQDELNKDDQDEMKGSLQIINSKSQQLLHFIDSYRQVAELPKPKKSLFNLKITIENVLKIFDSEFKSKNIKTHLNIAELNLNAVRGLIVSGDAFINGSVGLAKIKHNFPQAIAVEMEATAIAHVCHNFKVPFVVVRAISDVADQQSHLSFDEFLVVAAKQSSLMVETLVQKLAHG